MRAIPAGWALEGALAEGRRLAGSLPGTLCETMHSQMCSGYYLGKETGEKNSMTSAASIYIPSDSHLFNIRQVWSLEVKWPGGLRA